MRKLSDIQEYPSTEELRIYLREAHEELEVLRGELAAFEDKWKKLEDRSGIPGLADSFSTKCPACRTDVEFDAD